MRTDEAGRPCPSTLGEYRDFCAAIGGGDCRAVKLLDDRIAKQGRDEPVIAADSQMRTLLMPLLVPENFLCPACDLRSYNPTDVRERYCGACHKSFT